MKFEISLLLTNEQVSPGSVDSLREQLMEVVAEAVESKQLEIPDAEIYDYDIYPNNEPGFLD